jgi:hypothetical protein
MRVGQAGARATIREYKSQQTFSSSPVSFLSYSSFTIIIRIRIRKPTSQPSTLASSYNMSSKSSSNSNSNSSQGSGGSSSSGSSGNGYSVTSSGTNSQVRLSEGI